MLLRAEGIEQVGTTRRETRDQVMQGSQRLATFTPHAARGLKEETSPIAPQGLETYHGYLQTRTP